MGNPRQNDVGLELPYEAEQADGSRANAGSAEGMNRDPGRQDCPICIRLGNKSQVKVIFLRREAARQQRGDLLGTAAAKVRDEQEDSDTIRYGVFRKDR